MDNIKVLLEYENQFCSWGDTVHYNSEIHIFNYASGNYLYKDQIKFLDMQSAYSAVNFGYQNKSITDSIIKQLQTIPMLASEYLTKEKILLSKAIAESIFPESPDKGRVHFNVGGAQAVDDSLKLISVNKGTRRSFAFEGSYHGRTIGASALTSSYRYRNKYGNFSERANFIPFPYCFRCPYDKKKSDCGLFCIKQFARLFNSEYHAVFDFKDSRPEYVAFYMETIQGTGGYIIPPDGYFEELFKILHKYDIITVIDEIQMGMFRTGKMWSFEHFNVLPDIVLFGKSLTNGLNPLAGMWANDKLLNKITFPPGSTHSTFSNNPLGMTAGLATFQWIQQNNYEKSVPEKGRYFLARLQEIQKEFPQIGDVDGLGLALRIELCFEDGYTPNKFLVDRIKNYVLDNGVSTQIGELRLLLDIGGYYKNVITLAPPLDITYEEIDAFCDIFAFVMNKLI